MAASLAIVSFPYSDRVETGVIGPTGEVVESRNLQWDCEAAWKRVEGPRDGAYLSEPEREPCAAPMRQRRIGGVTLAVTSGVLMTVAFRRHRYRLAAIATFSTVIVGGLIVAFLTLPAHTPWSIGSGALLLALGTAGAGVARHFGRPGE